MYVSSLFQQYFVYALLEKSKGKEGPAEEGWRDGGMEKGERDEGFASGGTLEIHALDELMDGTEPKTPFAKEIVAYAQRNGVDPAVAAEALLNERGEAQMMAGNSEKTAT